MAHRYAPLPNPGPEYHAAQHDRDVELQATFDYSDDEDGAHDATESQPLNYTVSSLNTTPSVSTHASRTYDFESVDYDYPPPGSPPGPSTVALPNEYGNSNGLIPVFGHVDRRPPNQMWFQRAAAAVLPPTILNKLGLGRRIPPGPIGGGTNNDGVFANVTAKPSAPIRVQDGDDTYLVPEHARQEAPPSYASAQADAVPPYWETTIHAPFSPDSIGEMVIDSLPTGSLFSFCWNLLVSISFQFIGFLLTYLLHTSHAARLGSRAGLGVTLIQYGFALRSRLDSNDANDNAADWSEWNSEPHAEGHSMHHHHMGNMSWNMPMVNITEEQATIMVSNATTEWLSFFLMTIGWFVLLTSILSFWRIKRWERGIIASRETAAASVPQTRPGLLAGSFGFRGLSRADLYQGFGLGSRRRPVDDESNQPLNRGDSSPSDTTLPTSGAQLNPSNNIHGNHEIVRALANEQRLQRDLQEAGLL